ncbi:MAG: hypothetical protein LJE65_12930 [Desulfobacteraceae bacterium]|nr:hypothetical protein [Desulfobacteraceae bacterium]
MNVQKSNDLLIVLDTLQISPFSSLLQHGFQVKARNGNSLKELVCGHYGVDADYLKNRISTIFIDGKPVDNVEKTKLKDGSTVALSAAMPGLVGATFRSGGVLASFRSGISYQSEDGREDSQAVITVTVKLFNMLIREIGPIFLAKGIWAPQTDVTALLQKGGESLQPHIVRAEMDGREIPPLELMSWSGSEEAKPVFLRVVV